MLFSCSVSYRAGTSEPFFGRFLNGVLGSWSQKWPPGRCADCCMLATVAALCNPAESTHPARFAEGGREK